MKKSPIDLDSLYGKESLPSKHSDAHKDFKAFKDMGWLKDEEKNEFLRKATEHLKKSPTGYAESLRHEEKEDTAVEHAEAALEAIEEGNIKHGQHISKMAHEASKHAEKAASAHESHAAHRAAHDMHKHARNYHAEHHEQYEVSHHHEMAMRAHKKHHGEM